MEVTREVGNGHEKALLESHHVYMTALRESCDQKVTGPWESQEDHVTLGDRAVLTSQLHFI